MSVAFKKVDGVEDADVSLNEGTVTLKLKPGNKITVELVREIIRRNGFTAKESRVRVAGKVIERTARPALQVSGLDLVLLLNGAKDVLARIEQKTGQAAVLVGTIAEAKPNSPETMSVEKVER